MSDFKAKMHQIRFRLGFRPRRWESLQRSPDPLTGFQGLLLREGRGGIRRGENRDEKGEKAFLVMWPRRLSALNPPLNVHFQVFTDHFLSLIHFLPSQLFQMENFTGIGWQKIGGIRVRCAGMEAQICRTLAGMENHAPAGFPQK